MISYLINSGLIAFSVGLSSVGAFALSGGGFFDEFRCRSVAAAGDLLFFASPKKPKEKKGDPGACVPPLRYGQPVVLGPAGVSCKLAFGSNKHEP